MTALLVRVGDWEIGVLEHFEDESQRFSFSPGYVSALRDSRPVLGQIFEDRYPKAIYVGGPISWFTHLLPQGVMRRWRCRLLGLDEDDSFGLLSALGERGFQSVTTASFEKLISLLGLETAGPADRSSPTPVAPRSMLGIATTTGIHSSAEQITRIADHLAGLPVVTDAVPRS